MFLATNSCQHYAIKNIKKYCLALKNYRILGPNLPDQPTVIFRGARVLRNRAAPNVADPPVRPFFWKYGWPLSMQEM